VRLTPAEIARRNELHAELVRLGRRYRMARRLGQHEAAAAAQTEYGRLQPEYAAILDREDAPEPTQAQLL
jgi:hypothetical protein